MKKKLVAILTLCIMLCTALGGLTACTLLEKAGVETKTLAAPTNIRIENGSLYWNPVEYAIGYTVSVDNREYPVSDYQYPLTSISDGEHVFKVKANGDGVLYLTSGWSQEYKETLTDGQKTSLGYYGQFDELTKQESFLGYGFDVINSSVFSDKYVKTSFPIFNTEKLMEQRLLKVDSKQSYVEEIKSSSMEEFIEDWNAKANVNVKWGGKRVGGSVEVKAKYSGGVENAKSKYFHSISFYNQKFYIVLQSDINTYKDIVNESFKADLYSDMEPAQLFERYGTHFITSAVMGGKINSYYLYTSESEKSYHNVSTQVSTEVRAFKTGVNVSVGGGYKNTAQNENIYIHNTLEVIGGDDFGMISDEDISRNYLAWEKSLNEHASLMGIKDTSSLIPLWQLIDESLDTRTYTWVDSEGGTQTGSRSQQLQAYFEKYGVEAYNSLMVAAGLPEIITPESIDNIKVNNNDANNIGEYEVYAGVNNDISFSVKPDLATGYTKAASLTENTELATIENENGLSIKISPDCEHGKVFNVVLSAGSVRHTIKVRVVRKYTVMFQSNGGTETSAMLNVVHGTQIDAPTKPEKVGFEFKGWYSSADFKEETKYEFGATPVVSDLILYAKWEKYYPEITFIHSVQGSTLLKDKVEYNTAYAEPEEPKLTGYVFDGFYQDKEMLIPFDFTTLIKVPTSIYVKWEIYYPEITFIHNVKGSSLLNDKVRYNTAYEVPEVPELTGYVFAGFYKDNKMQTAFDFTELIKEPTNIYVKWEKYYPEITFVHNVQGSTLLKDKVEYNTAYAEPEEPKLTGYVFDGFYQDKEMLIPFDFTTLIKVPTSIYVKWTPEVYTVSFESDCDIIVPSQQVAYKTKAQKPIVVYKEGYEFMGWYINGAFNGPKFDFNNDVITGDTVLKAHWAEDPVTIVFDANGGTSIDSERILKGQSLGTKLPVATKDYYTFDGWYFSKEFKDGEKIYSNTKFTEDAVLYAKWNKKTYTISYNEDGGELIGEYTTTYQIGDVITLPEVIKEYNTFGGWYLDSSYINKVDTVTLSLHPANITANVKWIAYATYFHSSTPDIITDELAIINWSNVGEGDYVCDRTILIQSAKEVYFIGNPNATYLNLSICIGTDNPSCVETVIGIENLNVLNGELCLAEDSLGLNVTLEYKGKSSIIAKAATAAIGGFATLDITGEGEFTVIGGNGADGATAGASGADGAAGIVANNLTISGNGMLTVVGGNGGNGAQGADGSNGTWKQGAGHAAIAGGTGGVGGNGAIALECSMVTINTEIELYVTGGTGGDGGVGGKGGQGSFEHANHAGNCNGYEHYFRGGKGGNGGNGGNGGAPGIDLGLNSLYGNGGNGGTGGNGGASGNMWNTLGSVWQFRGGNGGNGGTGGNGYVAGQGGSGGEAGTKTWGKEFLVGTNYNNDGNASNGAVGKDGIGFVSKIERNGHVYYLMSGWVTWTEAKEFAESLGGYLATITDAEEDATLKQMMLSANLQFAWLGAESTSGSWQWITGEIFSYTNWNEGEPNNSDGKEHYLSYTNAANSWNDNKVDASEVKNFIIEFDSVK